MPFDLLFRFIEMLFHARKRQRDEDDRVLTTHAWHHESDLLARTDRPYPGT
jgi:hypothetical protein